jgi:small subunit ribosomal protein S17
MAKKKTETTETAEEPTVVDSVIDTVSSAVSTVVENVTNAVETAASVLTGSTTNGKSDTKIGRRAQKIGVVSSDKMTKTVVVKVDRLIKHPKYRRYVRRTTKFMAHDEMGAGIGDKVKIEESRPLSARKRWRVVEVIQKAAK